MTTILRSAVLCGVLAFVFASCTDSGGDFDAAWETLEPEGEPTARHEASVVAFKDKLYLIGGRRVNPVDVYDPATNSWTEKSETPVELHHFQSVVVGDAIYLMGAMTGGWPYETPLDKVMIYYPDEDRFEYGHDIPEARRRGGAGIVYHNDKIYMVGGITNGHWDGFVPWLDEYDPATGEWRVLPDAPRARDHFQAAVIDNRLYAFAGRRSEQRSGHGFEPTEEYGDIFDFDSGTWLSPTEALAIPTRRAGNMVFVWNNELVIGGGESGSQEPAHSEVESFDSISQTWRAWPSLQRGRHGSGFAVIGDYVYTASGCGNRGGQPELSSVERLKLPASPFSGVAGKEAPRGVVKQWHTMTLAFDGPETSESAEENPFTDYRLLVDFSSPSGSKVVRGFYAADGNASETSAESGNQWAVRFTPDEVGEWTYSASLRKGDMIAISRDGTSGEEIPLSDATGRFLVSASDKDLPDLRDPDSGFLGIDGRYFRFGSEGRYWLKGGTNSPENLLAYEDFDGTHRLQASSEEGESSVNMELHSYPSHLADWKEGDPVWGGGKGKTLVGAINYLASKGMNSVYFLTLNILGDGKDVWPYRDPEDFTRFDVSKLEQWNVLFDHMQERGMLLHFVTQETENELMLDGGDTGPQRSLYYSELIARFAHHPALVWNLGEENGPAHWMPTGQSDDQRKAMAQYFHDHDPYGHPVLLHTHSEPAEKDKILEPLLGFAPLDGLSFQVDQREMVNGETQKWLTKAKESGRDWLITMDEIGIWHTGAVPDAVDPTHDSLRRHALWGHLFAGGAGVEWYFGAKYPGNDLGSEDWRMRDELWTQTKHAMDFFENLPYWEMNPCGLTYENAYCFEKANEVYAVYLIDGARPSLTLPASDTGYDLRWFDPMAGGELKEGSVTTLDSGTASLGRSPDDSVRDWVVLVTRREASEG